MITAPQKETYLLDSKLTNDTPLLVLRFVGFVRCGDEILRNIPISRA